MRGATACGWRIYHMLYHNNYIIFTNALLSEREEVMLMD